MALPTITNNSPSAGRIAWSAFGIQYDGVGYSVPAGNSASKFIWWAFNNGSPSVQGANVLPDLAPEDYLLFLNKSGIGTLVDTTQVIDGSLIVSQSILADGIGANQIQTQHLTANAVTTDKLAANSVTANEVAAGAITASKLSIGAVGDNMVLNGSFEDGTQGFTLVSSGAGAVADVVTGVSSSGANALRLVRGTASNLIVGQDAGFYIPVTSVAGRSWYVACRAGAGSALASGFYLRVYWYQADKTTAASTASVDIASNKELTTAWSVFEGAVTPPANARYMRVAVINALSGSTMYVDEITAHEVVVAAQIGDNQITTPKLVADAVTTEKITANAVTAAKVAANAITVTQLAANAVTAGKIAANAVTATHIAATAIDGMTITGATMRTAATGQRLQLDVNGLRAFNAADTETVRLSSDGQGLMLARSNVLGRTRISQAVPSDSMATQLLSSNPSGEPGDQWYVSTVVDSELGLFFTDYFMGGDKKISINATDGRINAGQFLNEFGGVSAPYASAAGEFSTGVTVAAGSSISYGISFPTGRFTQPPHVFVSTESGRFSMFVASVTATGFTIGVNNWSPGAAAAGVRLRWHAVQMLKTGATG